MGILTINHTDGSHWASNPNRTQWEACWDSVVAQLVANLNPPANITINITRDYGFEGSLNLGTGTAGHSSWSVSTPTYATLKSDLQGLTAKSSLQTTAYAGLPSVDPLSASVIQVSDTLTMAMEGIQFTPSILSVGFGTSSSGWDLTADGTTCAAGKINLWGVMMHEITEVLGRASLGTTTGAGSGVFYPADYFTYKAAGNREFAQSGFKRYLSDDGGTTVRCYLNQGGGDGGDGPVAGDPSGFIDTSAFCATGTPPTGVAANPMPARNWQYLNLIGWQLTTAGDTAAGLSGAAPVNTALPTISGDPGVGHTLTVTQGTWTNSPTSISHQWKAGVGNVGTNSTTYVPVTGDIGKSITVDEVATNASGSNTATSTATARVRPVYSVTT